ncbi:MAG: heme o synthase [Hyphomicrobiales bacterium]|nr:heme o synthase [Hyphomicrobiales bacterium]MDE2016388.1 heme o synthase [Hyphomicrobiales bacterium]
MSLALETPAIRVSDATPGDYLELLKPRVMSLVVFTALVGMLASPVHPHPVVAAASLLAIAVGAGASGALNMWWDADIDALMGRTRGRPIPSGRVTGPEALAFGLILSVLSVVTLTAVAGPLAGALLAFTIFFYAVVYTMLLKRRTPQNIVIGGAAGALPPVIGYAAAGGGVTWASLSLFLVIFLWTPPHFWALALLKAGEYAKAGVPMLPNVKGEKRTRLEILLYTLVLAPAAAAPWALGLGGRAYLAVCVAGGAGMLALAGRVFRADGTAADRVAAGRLFAFSILYLFCLFAALLAERALGAFA